MQTIEVRRLKTEKDIPPMPEVSARLDELGEEFFSSSIVDGDFDWITSLRVDARCLEVNSECVGELNGHIILRGGREGLGLEHSARRSVQLVAA